MTLRTLLDPIEARDVQGSLDVEIGGIAYDSRRVRPGDAFFALTGTRVDGAAFARQALAAGAVALVVGKDVAADGVTVVRVVEPRRALALAAARFHGRPDRALKIVAITGTNGKTTTTYLLEAIFRAAGWTPGLIGTTGVHLGDEQRAAALTTPESLELWTLLAEMRDRGVSAVALEISSHALVQRRAYGLGCDVKVFTNLSHDHLDYHGSMEAYLDAKLMLFDGRNDASDSKAGAAAVPADEAVTAEVEAAASRGDLAVLRYRGEPNTTAARLAVEVTTLTPHRDGLDLELRLTGAPWSQAALGPSGVRTVSVRLPMLGRYNAANAAAAFAAGGALDLAPETIVRGLESVTGVPGRLERVAAPTPFTVVVDYAHTPDALARSLAAIREHAAGRVLLVFGCGGDRDRAKRPLMGRVAAERADRVWITNDNPRGEDPAAIARAIETGMGDAPHEVELDRRRAIARALEAARPGDVVLIAGKGHETTQTIGDRILAFDDRRVAAELLASASGGGA
jgi:UDP-N-acetylmuramoyl-L-alanyl-D-glutamate--2,6-diaminopimelate ligase